MKLSEHFTLAEAESSQSAARLGIDNTCPQALHGNLIRVAAFVLEPVRAQFGVPFSPTSWFRSKALNKAIGGSAKSQHCRGEAVDLKLPGVDTFTLAAWVAQELDFDQLILECYRPGQPNSGWVHVSMVEGHLNRGECLTYDGKRYYQGLVA